MPTQLYITGSGFTANETTATTGTTGLAAVSGLTHRHTSKKLASGTFVGVLSSAENSACSFQLGPGAPGATSPFQVDEYVTIGFKFRLRTTLPGSLPAAFGAMNATQLMNNSTLFILYGSNNDSGLLLWTQNFAGGGNWDQASQPPIGYEQWSKLKLRVKRGAAGANNGCAELFINGVRVSYARGDYSSLARSFAFNWPAFPGGVWEFDGPFEQWSGTDCPIAADRTEFLNDPRDGVHTGYLAVNDNDLHVDASPSALDVLVTQVSGSTTKTVTSVSSGGVNPYMKYRAMTGSGSVIRFDHPLPDLTPVFTDKWLAWHFPLMYIPTGTTAQIKLMRSGVVGLTLDIGTVANQVTLSGVSKVSFPQANACSLSLFLQNTGRLFVMTTDQTTFPNASRTTWGSQLPTWNTATMGGWPDTVRVEYTLGASGGHLASGWLLRRLTMFGPDSISDGNAFGYTPQYNVGTNVMFNPYTMGTDGRAVPGIVPNYYLVPCQPRYYPLFLGRGGLKSSEFVTYVLPGLAEVEGGLEIVYVEGSVNDIVSVSDMATVKTAVDAVDALDATLQSWANAIMGRRLTVTTFIDRPLSTSWSGGPSTATVGLRQATLRGISEKRRARFVTSVTSPCQLIDVAGMVIYTLHDNYIDTGNPPHFTTGLEGGNQVFYSLLMGGMYGRFASTDLTSTLLTLLTNKAYSIR